MIAEAVDTVFTLGWALLAWIALTALVVTLAGWTVAYAAWVAARTLWAACAAMGARNGLSAPLAAEQPSGGPEAVTAPERRSEPRSRPAPSWAHTDHHRNETTA